MARTKEPRAAAAASSSGNGHASTISLPAFGTARVVTLQHDPVAALHRFAPAGGRETDGTSHEPSPELNEKIKELLRLAQEQGYLTYNDIHDVLPNSASSPEVLEEVLTQVRNLEIDIVDPAEVDRV